MTKKITISLDCMGGDNAPNSVIEGMKLASQEFKDEVKFLLFGDKSKIENLINKNSILSEYEIIDTGNDIVSPDEKPSIAIRKCRKSSMALAIESVKLKNSDASISAGNTGALMALSKIILRTLPDITRPALIQLMPNTNKGCTALLDMGANIDCDYLNLCQFAVMGVAYYDALMSKEKPTVALLNVGSEETKGNDVIKEASTFLKESKLSENFTGFVEGNEILTGKVDVVVADGFAGNISLKSIEGTSKVFSKFLKEMYSSNIFTKIGYLFVRRKLNKLKQMLNPEMYNGAMLIGLNGISIKSHGNANGTAFYHAIKNTINLVKSDINSKITYLVNELEN